jgi:outer membrane receptor protein involved in Fe transport
MRRLSSWIKLAIPGTLGGALACGLTRADEPRPLPPPPPDAVSLLTPPGASPDGNIILVQQPPSVTAAQPVAPAAETAPAAGGGGSRDLFGSAGGGGAAAAPGAAAGPGAQAPAAAPSASQISAAGAPAASTVSGIEAVSRAASDLGDLLGKSQSSLGVEVQRRNPIITDPRVRGQHVGQLLTIADGAFFFPARVDLDTIVSKIDSSLIRDVVVVKGPYSVRMGPGFTFFNVETLGSPRFQEGFEAHGATAVLFKTNGDQWHGRQDVWGGDSDYGFRIGYDLMSGSDYRWGDGRQQLVSGYSAQNVYAAFGFDLSPDSGLEFRTIYQDLHNVFLPGQAFDIEHGYTESFTARYTLNNQDYFDRFTLDAWYNESRFDGNNFLPAQQIQLFATNPSSAFTGVTNGDIESTGYRAAVSWGQEKHVQFAVGTDLEYLSNRVAEYDTIIGKTFAFPIPRAYLFDPGVFADTTIPLLDNHLIIKAGVRADWATSDIIDLPPDQAAELANIATIGPGPYHRDFDLWATYLTGEYKCTDHWTVTAGTGQAMRPPTPTELFAGGPFLAVVQNGLNFVNGNKLLNPEQLWQLDLGLKAEYETFRFGVNGFYSWFHDYITFQELPGTTANGIRGIAFVNTNRATLSGFELYAEWDMFDYLTPFVTANYVEGRDYSPPYPQQPLPGIYPLEGRLGFRFHEPRRSPRWGMEFLMRMVAGQNRIANSPGETAIVGLPNPGGLGEQPTPGFTVFNVRGFWQVNKAILLTAGVENLGDRFYREALDLRTGLGVYQPGISFYFGTQVSY